MLLFLAYFLAFLLIIRLNYKKYNLFINMRMQAEVLSRFILDSALYNFYAASVVAEASLRKA